MAISVRKIGHVGILVADVQRSLDFYTDVMGFTVTSLRKDGEGEVVGAFMRFDEEHHNFRDWQGAGGCGCGGCGDAGPAGAADQL